MTRKKNTDLKLTEIKKMAKSANSQKQHVLENGQTITFYPTFPPTLIEEMLKEISTTLSSNPELKLTEEQIHKYILFMTVKHFTHLKEQFTGTSLTEQLNEMKSLVDSGCFEIIVDEIFLPDEIKKVFDQAAKMSSKYAYLERLAVQMEDEIKKLDIRNNSLLEKLSDKNAVIQ